MLVVSDCHRQTAGCELPYKYWSLVLQAGAGAIQAMPTLVGIRRRRAADAVCSSAAWFGYNIAICIVVLDAPA